jgi:cell division ATPase FtsA
LFSAYNAYEIIPTFQPLLNCLAAGLNTGMVVDIGHFLTQITPVINGVIVTDGVRVVDFGGKDITDLLQNLLTEGDAFKGLQESAILSPAALSETVKELFCYVSRNPADELNNPAKKDVNLPLLSGESIQIGVERFLAPETLFTPQKQDVKPLDVLVQEVLSSFDVPVQQILLGNILLTGGTSLIPGLMERLYEELVRKFIDYKINIIPFAKFGSPRYSTFFGASKLTANEIYGSLKISKVDYEYAGKFTTPVTFMENFGTFFDQAAKVPLKSIIISVKNFYNSRLYQQLYNIINSQRETSLEELGNRLQRSPFELYNILEALQSYKIITGELQGLKFINSQVKEEKEEGHMEKALPKPEQASQVEPARKEEPYMPSFQLYSTGGAAVEPSKDQTTKPEEPYVPSFERYQTGGTSVEPPKDQPIKPEEPYVPSFERYQTGGTSVEPPKDQPTKPEKPYAPSFELYEGTAPTGPQLSAPKARVTQETDYTYEKIDKEMAEEWAKDDSIITEDKVIPRFEPSIPKDESGSFTRVDKEMEEEWKKTGRVAEVQQRKPKGFFEEPTKKEELLWEVSAAPSFVKADKEMEEEWKAEGKVFVPKKITPKGFFEQPAAQKDEELLTAPTFLQIKEQEIPQPRKVMIADLLKPKIERVTPTPVSDTKLPTFLQGQELDEDQLQQLKEFEEKEQKRKEKEEKLL